MEVIRVLAQSKPAGGGFYALFGVGIDKGVVISFLNICNTDVYDASVRIAIYRDESPDPEHYVEYGMLIYGNCSAQRLKGVTLAQGDKIGVYSSSGNVTFSLFGSEFDQSYEYA